MKVKYLAALAAASTGFTAPTAPTVLITSIRSASFAASSTSASTAAPTGLASSTTVVAPTDLAASSTFAPSIGFTAQTSQPLIHSSTSSSPILPQPLPHKKSRTNIYGLYLHQLCIHLPRTFQKHLILIGSAEYGECWNASVKRLFKHYTNRHFCRRQETFKQRLKKNNYLLSKSENNLLS